MSRDHYNILKIYPSPIRFFLCVDAVTTAPTCCYRDINYLTSLFWSELGDIFSLKYTAKWKTVGQRSNHTHNLNHKSINNWKETSFSISLGYRYCFLIFITFTSFLFLFLLYQLPPSLFSLFFSSPDSTALLSRFHLQNSFILQSQFMVQKQQHTLIDGSFCNKINYLTKIKIKSISLTIILGR